MLRNGGRNGCEMGGRNGAKYAYERAQPELTIGEVAEGSEGSGLASKH